MTTTATIGPSTRTVVFPLFAIAVLARLPLATLSLGVLVHVEHLTGSFAVAGLVAGGLAVAQAAGGPLLGRCVDGRGQTGPLLVASVVAAAALGGLAEAPPGIETPLLMLLAVLLGLATPPVGACLRSLLADVVPAGPGLRRAYAVDTAATELTWVSGPPLVLLVAGLFGSSTALLACSVVVLSGTWLFAALPASRAWRPVTSTSSATDPRALQSAGVRTLVLALIGAGGLFGATEVAVTATTDAMGRGGAAGPLLGLWGVGSFVGGVCAARFGGGARTGAGLAALLGVLGLAHLALAASSHSVVPLGVGLVLGGVLIAPILATAYTMVAEVAPEGTATESFAWIATATAIGTAAGAAAAGALAQYAGAHTAFILAGAGALLGALVAMTRRNSLPAGQPPRPHAVGTVAVAA